MSQYRDPILQWTKTTDSAVPSFDKKLLREEEGKLSDDEKQSRAEAAKVVLYSLCIKHCATGSRIVAVALSPFIVCPTMYY